MSHDDVKSFRNALIVMSGLATLVPVAGVGWMANAAISALRQESSAAVNRVEGALSGVRSDLSVHKTWDDEWSRNVERRLNACCPEGNH